MVFNATFTNISVVVGFIGGGNRSAFLAHLAFRPCELLSSLFVRRLSSVRQHFTSSPQKPLDQLQPNFGGMVHGWPPFKIVSGDPDFQPRWPPS